MMDVWPCFPCHSQFLMLSLDDQTVLLCHKKANFWLKRPYFAKRKESPTSQFYSKISNAGNSKSNLVQFLNEMWWRRQQQVGQEPIQTGWVMQTTLCPRSAHHSSLSSCWWIFRKLEAITLYRKCNALHCLCPRMDLLPIFIQHDVCPHYHSVHIGIFVQ